MPSARLDAKTLSLTPGKRISLFDLDLSFISGPILRFTPNREDSTPETCTRVADTSTGAAGSTLFTFPTVPAAGEVFGMEVMLRKSSADAALAMFQLSPDGNASNRDRVNINFGTLALSAFQLSPVTSARTFRISPAGEWLYFTAQWTMGPTPPSTLALRFIPTSAFGTNGIDIALTGSVDMFGFRAYIVRDGLRIPIVSRMDMLDWAVSGGAISRTTEPNTYEAVKVPVWQGNTYTPIPITASGFEKSGNGAFPRPKLSMSNLTGAGSALMQIYGDIRGATVTRTRLYADHLDNGPDPDPSAFYQPDVFTLVRRSGQDGQDIEFELASKLDQQGVKLPRRQLLRDICEAKYRVWDPTLNSGAGGFDYSKATCPYSGAAKFDMNGNAVTNGAEDKCSHTLTNGCRKRFGTHGDLPFGGFPMVGRFRR